MNELDQDFWQARYDEQATGWDVGTVSRPLKEYIDQLKDKTIRILIPGCGFGHEAHYLAEHGFTDVTVIDLVEDAVTGLRNAAPSVKIVIGDFFEYHGSYDLILEQTLFCAIHPSRRIEYVTKVYELLAENGKYVGVLFNRDFPGGPPFGGSTQEYEQYLKTHFCTWKLEPCFNSIAPRMGTELFVIARKTKC